jgi:7-carboxy-7-deazaguanine synthase
MYGQNVITKQNLDSPDLLNIHEVFATIQGEGPFSGHPALFTRLSQCSLKCYFCDTPFDNVNKMQVGEIVRLAKVWRNAAPERNLVVVTGGEPFIQNLCYLLRDLATAKFHIQIETAGTHWLVRNKEKPVYDPIISFQAGDCTPGQVSIVCSPKTPTIHDAIAKNACCYKYIVAVGDAALDDGLPMQSTQRLGVNARLFRPVKTMTRDYERVFPVPIYVQPRDDGEDVESTQANVKHARDVALKYGYRLSLQLHKMLGLP